MINQEDLGRQIVMAGATGALDGEAVSAAMHVLAGGSLLREVPTEQKKKVGIGAISQTLDEDGNLLVAGRNYMYRGQKIKVLREEFGCGNVVDSYQRIYFLDSSLEERFMVVQANYPRGIFSAAEYRSSLTPVPESLNE